ncbi:MAG: hypothetical protein FWE60_03205 [Oscillospiraceae bacterium]|nr:hypothetical protein [Oscillospiraceae bacterium]
MKKFKKAICFIMVFIFILTSAPMSRTSAKLSKYKRIDVSFINQYQNEQTVSLKIGDLTFKGGILNLGLTDEELAKIIEQTLKEIGLTAEQVFEGEVWSKYRDAKSEEFKHILERYTPAGQVWNFIFGIGGMAPGAAGTFISIGGTIYTGVTSDGVSGTAVGAGGAAGGAAVGDALYGPTGSMVSGLAWLLQLILQGLDDQDNVRNALERITQHLHDIENWVKFRNALITNVEKYIDENGLSVQVKFENCVAERDFQFYKTSNKSVWTLNMKLDKNGVEAGGACSTGGTFELEAASDFGGFYNDPITAVNNLPGIEGDIQKVIDQDGGIYAQVTAHSEVKPAQVNQPSLKRTIKGKVEMIYYAKQTELDVKFMQESDKRYVNFSYSPGFSYRVWTTSNLGKLMEKSCEFKFELFYSGSGDPEFEITGTKPYLWFNERFYPVNDLAWFNTERKQILDDVTEQADKYKKKYPWDTDAWEPWGKPNPSATLQKKADPARR